MGARGSLGVHRGGVHGSPMTQQLAPCLSHSPMLQASLAPPCQQHALPAQLTVRCDRYLSIRPDRPRPCSAVRFRCVPAPTHASSARWQAGSRAEWAAAHQPARQQGHVPTAAAGRGLHNEAAIWQRRQGRATPRDSRLSLLLPLLAAPPPPRCPSYYRGPRPPIRAHPRAGAQHRARGC